MSMKRAVISAALAILALVSGLGQAQTVREACAADAAKFCADASDLQSRMQCMDRHRTELSTGCREARRAAQRAAGGVQAEPVVARSGLSPPDGRLDSIPSRIGDREFPSVFAPWNAGSAPAPPGSGTDWATVARHDFYFQDFSRLGLKVVGDPPYLMQAPSFEFTPESIQTALQNRAALLEANPHMVILSSVHYDSAPPRGWLPPDSSLWQRNAQFDAHNREYGSHRIDYSSPAYQDKVAAFCGALVKSGVFDGCMLDGWHDDNNTPARVSLIKKIRAAIGDKALLVGNVNQKLPTNTAKYLNGMYMEGFETRWFPDWHQAAANLLWGESHLRHPVITALEGWYPCPTADCRGDPLQLQRQGRAEAARMRNITTLSLVFSNGYALFSDPNELPTPDHLHDWYPFWDKSLGKPVGPVATLDRPDPSGAYTRQYQNGEVVFNPASNHPAIVNFAEPRRSVATNLTARSFTVSPGDGDLFLTVERF